MHKDSFTSPFQILMHLISFACLTALIVQRLIETEEEDTLALFLVLGESLQSFTIMMLATGVFARGPLSGLRKFSSIPHLQRSVFCFVLF